MSVDRTEGRRTNHRAFRPTLDGGLESRFLLSNLPGIVFLNHPQPGVAYVHKQPPLRSGTHAEPFPIATFPRGPRDKVEVAHGGQSVIVATPDGSHFQISLTQFVPTPSTSTTGAAVAVTQPPIQGQSPGRRADPADRDRPCLLDAALDVRPACPASASSWMERRRSPSWTSARSPSPSARATRTASPTGRPGSRTS